MACIGLLLLVVFVVIGLVVGLFFSVSTVASCSSP
tara:strand:- start:138 stop:242 length:105 start_codon:yes stop_codon:yes gene_type:complete